MTGAIEHGSEHCRHTHQQAYVHARQLCLPCEGKQGFNVYTFQLKYNTILGVVQGISCHLLGQGSALMLGEAAALAVQHPHCWGYAGFLGGAVCGAGGVCAAHETTVCFAGGLLRLRTKEMAGPFQSLQNKELAWRANRSSLWPARSAAVGCSLAAAAVCGVAVALRLGHLANRLLSSRESHNNACAASSKTRAFTMHQRVA
jgi:hypothetical protein